MWTPHPAAAGRMLAGLGTRATTEFVASDGSVWANRSWKTGPSNPQPTSFFFEYRLLVGEPGHHWILETGSLTQGVTFVGGEVVAKLTNKGDTGTVARQQVALEDVLAGRRFRGTVSVTNGTAFTAHKCPIRLQEANPPFRSVCGSVTPSDGGKSAEVEWLMPLDSTATGLRLVVEVPPSEVLYVASSDIEEYTEGQWQTLGPLEPTGVSMRVDSRVTGAQRLLGRVTSFEPGPAWKMAEVDLENQAPAQANLTAVVTVEQGLTVQVRNTGFLGPDRQRIVLRETPDPNRRRIAMFLSHPNIAGAATVAWVVTLLLLLPGRFMLWLVVIGVGLGIVQLTDSRAALIALFLVAVLATIKQVSLKSWLTSVLFTSLLAAATLGLFLLPGTNRLANQVTNSTSSLVDQGRLEAWRFAASGFLTSPIKGAAMRGSDTVWHEHFEGLESEAPTHAHNLWLQFAWDYGVFGLLALLLIIAWMASRAWRLAGWFGTGLLIVILLMNMVDNTLLQGSVILPLSMVLSEQRELTRRAAQ